MAAKKMHLDASESVYFNRQIEVVQSNNYNTETTPLVGVKMVPVKTDYPKTTRTITVRGYTKVGMAQLISGYSDDLPRSDVAAHEASVQVKDMGASYGYNFFEIQAAAANGIPLDTMKAAAAKQSIDVLTDRIAATGDSATGLYGLINQPNALSYTVPNGAGGVATWIDAGTGEGTKTGLEIVKDVLNTIQYIRTQTFGLESPNTVALPEEQFGFISMTPFSEHSDTTILEYLRSIKPGITFEPWLALGGAGSGGSDRMLVYDKNPNKIALSLPRPFEQLPVEKRGLEYVVDCVASTGGVVAWYPMSIAVADGI